MSTPFPGFSSPAASFDEPFELLAACHERMEAQLQLLDRLPAHLATHGADPEARSAAQRMLRYFDEAAPKHHADEEADLFPLLEAHAEFPDLLPLLRQEHRAMEAAYARLRPVLKEVAAGTSADLPADITSRFCDLYRTHIARENTLLLPAARRAVTGPERENLGKAMAARRQI